MVLHPKLPDIVATLSAGSLDFTGRFMAWWNGESVESRKRRSADGVPVAEIAGVLGGPDKSTSPDGERNVDSWSTERLKIMQLLWGAGFNVPGGSDYIPDLIAGMTPSDADTLLNIGIGLGGIPLAVSTRFGAYVASINPVPQLCRLFDELALGKGIEGKLTVRASDAAPLSVRPGYHAGAILIEHLFREENKGDFLVQVANSVKADALVVGTDLLFDGDEERPEIRNWQSTEYGRVYPGTYKALQRALGDAGLTIRNLDLDTDDYVRRIVDALSHMLEELHRLKSISGELDAPLSRALLRETEFWGIRVAAMRAGALHHVKFVAVKRD